MKITRNNTQITESGSGTTEITNRSVFINYIILFRLFAVRIGWLSYCNDNEQRPAVNFINIHSLVNQYNLWYMVFQTTTIYYY